MGAILDQLGLDYTFFVQLGLFAMLFLVLSAVYFKPFLRLFEERQKRTIHDRAVAEKLMEQAQAKFEEFRVRMAQERAAARKDYEGQLKEAQLEEEAMLAKAWAEARKITQESAENATNQRELIKYQLAQDIELLSETISERLIAGRK